MKLSDWSGRDKDMGKITIIGTIRHGETDFNRQKRYCGAMDVPLNDAGREDATHVRNKLSGDHFDVIISSKLIRAVETAQVLLNNGAEFIQSELCNERNYGKLQGMTADEVKWVRPPLKYICRGDDYHSLNPPGGETFKELRKRADEFCEFLFGRFSGRSLLIVSHGVFLQQFHGSLRGKNWKDSLEKNVANFQYTTFKFMEGQLVSETSINLAEREQCTW
jgi:broad specificity phosphatase PhoE